MKSNVLELDHCRIILAEITESAEELLPMLDNFSAYSNEFKQIKVSKRKKEFISVRFLMNLLLQKNVIIAYDNVHKPYIIDSEYSISVSHSGNYYALMVSRKGSTGIDIECRTSRVLRVRQRYLDQHELAFMMVDDNDTRALEIAWSAKEALYKIIGSEAYDFHTLKLRPFRPDSQGMLVAFFELAEKVFTLHYMQNEAYTMVYCVD